MVGQNEELYGKAATHAEHQPGDRVKFRDPEAPGGIDSGEVIYCCEGLVPVSYMVLPDSTGFPCPVLASAIVEQ